MGETFVSVSSPEPEAAFVGLASIQEEPVKRLTIHRSEMSKLTRSQCESCQLTQTRSSCGGPTDRKLYQKHVFVWELSFQAPHPTGPWTGLELSAASEKANSYERFHDIERVSYPVFHGYLRNMF
jgi:hypothetical protein